MKRYYEKARHFIECEEIFNCLCNREDIIENLGKEHFDKLYKLMCNSVRWFINSKNRVSISLPKEDIRYNEDLFGQLMVIEFDVESDETFSSIGFDEELEKCYVEI